MIYVQLETICNFWHALVSEELLQSRFSKTTMAMVNGLSTG